MNQLNNFYKVEYYFLLLFLLVFTFGNNNLYALSGDIETQLELNISSGERFSLDVTNSPELTFQDDCRIQISMTITIGDNKQIPINFDVSAETCSEAWEFIDSVMSFLLEKE